MVINISEIIRKKRVERKWSQEYLAEKLGVSFQAVSKWERGETYPDLQIVPEIAELFHISTDELLGADKTREKEEVDKIIYSFRKLDLERNYTEIVRIADEALKRFPNNYPLMGWIVYAGLNVDPRRSVDLAEYILANCLDSSIRNWIQRELCYALFKCGDKNKAIENAKMLPNADETKQFVLIDLLTGAEAVDYITGYPMRSLCHNFNRMIKKLLPYYDWRQQIELLKKAVSYADLLWESSDVSSIMPEQIDNYMKIAELYFENGEAGLGTEFVRKAADLAVRHDGLPKPGESKALLLNCPECPNNIVNTVITQRDQRSRVKNWLETAALLDKDSNEYKDLLIKLQCVS